MGSEAWCLAHIGELTSEGKAFLESDEIIFRGDFRLSIPLAEITSMACADGVLELDWPEGTVAFDLGPKADIWAARIANPKTRIDKLGVPSGSTVTVLRVDDEDFLDELRGRTSGVTPGRLRRGSNVVFFGAMEPKHLDQLQRAAEAITPDGAVWVVYPKGGAEPTEAQVLAAGRAAGLVDVKVVSFSESHTALKFVIPKDRRG